ncbi:MAG: 50S ribosomal protein L25/general stress protein Ctc [Bacteroidales bacterium]
MKTFEIKVKARKVLGKKETAKLRKEEQIPCVLYGGKEVIHFYGFNNDFRGLLYTPHVYIVKLDIEGDVHQAILHEMQLHPVSDAVTHIDFVEVFDDKPVVIDIPVLLEGSSEGVKAGGKLKLTKRLVKVKALPKHLPDALNVDVTELQVGKSIRVGDLSFPNIEFVESKKLQVVTVLSSRVVAKGMEEPTPAGAPAEGAAPAAGAASPAAAPSKEK